MKDSDILIESESNSAEMSCLPGTFAPCCNKVFGKSGKWQNRSLSLFNTTLYEKI